MGADGWCSLLAILVLAACNHTAGPATPPAASPAPPLTLLTLGDSYTVGQGIRVAGSWPAQLADSLAAGGDTLHVRDKTAGTGWSTRSLLTALRDSVAAGGLRDRPYGLVTVMIGVNDQYAGLGSAAFTAHLDTLAALAIDLAGGDPGRVLGFTIPDWGVTPAGLQAGGVQISRDVEAYNSDLLRRLAAAGIPCLDLTDMSRQARDEPALVAADGLHYTAEMYRRWVAHMLPHVRDTLGLAP